MRFERAAARMRAVFENSELYCLRQSRSGVGRGTMATVPPWESRLAWAGRKAWPAVAPCRLDASTERHRGESYARKVTPEAVRQEAGQIAERKARGQEGKEAEPQRIGSLTVSPGRTFGNHVDSHDHVFSVAVHDHNVRVVGIVEFDQQDASFCVLGHDVDARGPMTWETGH
jgi:hypothetical protein